MSSLWGTFKVLSLAPRPEHHHPPISPALSGYTMSLMHYPPTSLASSLLLIPTSSILPQGMAPAVPSGWLLQVLPALSGISLEKPFLIIPSKVDPPWTSTSPCSMTLSGSATVPVSQCSYGLFLCGLLAVSPFRCGISSMRGSLTEWTWPGPGL